MKRSHFTSDQIVFALWQAESGTPVAEVCRKMGIVEQIFYHWKKKHIGMSVAEVRRPKVPEEENRKLKQLVADIYEHYEDVPVYIPAPPPNQDRYFPNKGVELYLKYDISEIAEYSSVRFCLTINARPIGLSGHLIPLLHIISSIVIDGYVSDTFAGDIGIMNKLEARGFDIPHYELNVHQASMTDELLSRYKLDIQSGASIILILDKLHP